MENKIHDAFDRVHASEEMKESILSSLQKEREKKAHGRFSWKAVLVPALCALAAFAVLGWRAAVTPVAYLSLDVNPSIELGISRFDRVVSAAALNEDGAKVLAGLDVEGKSCSQALDILLSSEAMQPYLTEDSDLTVTVACTDSDREAAILAAVEDCSGYQLHHGESTCVDVETIEQAHDCGLSFGKYNAYLQLRQYEPDLTAEECQGMTISEIHQRICEHEEEHDADQTDGTHHEEEVHEEETCEEEHDSGHEHHDEHE